MRFVGVLPHDHQIYSETQMSSIRSGKLTDEMQAEGGAAGLKRNELLTGEVQRLETGNKLIEAGAIAHKNLSIQCLRGLAALFVALFHASAFSGAHFGDSRWAVFDGRFGLVGVAVFFAISGLLMADLLQRTDPWRFLAHRIVRIYPTFLLAVSVWLPLVALLGIGKIAPHVFSLMLVPVGPRAYYLGVEWTLVFECTYYVALFLTALVGWRRYLNSIVLVWIALIGTMPLFVGWSDDIYHPFYSIWLAPANVAFAGGLLIRWIASKIRIPVGTGILALCILMVALPANPVIARWAVGAVATLLVLDAVRIKVPPRALLGLPRLGDWSYALYLCHAPCIWVVYHSWPSSYGVGAAWFSAVAAAIVVSAGFGMLDVRMYKYLKKAVDNAGEEQRRRKVNIYAGAFIIASLVGVVVV
jgi:exopolysaccharide production protein ExoZ